MEFYFSLVLSRKLLLNHTLVKPVHEALRQRITVPYSFQRLQTDEVANYIFHKLVAVGGSKSMIDENAIHAFTNYCQSNPHMIDESIVDALALGSQLNRRVIDTEVTLSTVNEQTLG